MAKSLTYVLSIAGFDPSGGAGILADIKTFEHFKCMGLAVQTANTIQTDSEFLSVNWINKALIKEQLQVLLNTYKIDFVKIGLISNLHDLNELVETCLSFNPKIKIIWDTVLSASSGFNFNQDIEGITSLLPKLFLITPNWEEISKISGGLMGLEGAKKLAQHCKIYLKGGHNTQAIGKDFLVESQNNQIKVTAFNPRPTVKSIFPKHGSGCVFSSALTANLAKGYTLKKSILKSKRYIEHYLSSNPTLLGTHKL